MSSYRRFVAYVYEYQGEHKKGNRGFIKVEARNGSCVMDVRMQCPNLAPEQECVIYGFLRKKQDLLGVELGSCKSQQGKIECRLVTKVDSLNGKPIRLDDLNGMVILTEGGGFYATGWDDESISPMSFTKPKNEPEEKRTVQDSTQRDAAWKNSEEPAEKRMPAEMLEENEAGREEIKNPVENVEGGNSEELAGGAFSERQTTDAGEELEELENEKANVPQLELPGQENSTENSEIAREEEEEREEDLWESAGPESIEPEQAISAGVAAQEYEGEKEMRAAETIEGEEMENAFWPFEDGEIMECRKLNPGDFRYLHRKDWPLKNNRFLLHGYQQFGHLLLGKIRGSGQSILGVPGIYNQQERMMANMFGFPHFKTSRLPEFGRLSGGRGGYWYRLINTPNLNSGNRRL